MALMALVRGEGTPPEAVAASAANWNRHMGMLDAQLARTGAHVCGEAFTLADVVLGLAAQRWRSTPIEHAELPAVAAWMERLRTRSGFSECVDNGMP